MISKAKLLERIVKLEKQVKPLTLSVPVVDKDGESVSKHHYTFGGLYPFPKFHDLSFAEVCKAIQDMCGIEITYQEIKGKSGVVIYENDYDR